MFKLLSSIFLVLIVTFSMVLGVNANASAGTYEVTVSKLNVRNKSCQRSGVLSKGDLIEVMNKNTVIKCKINGKIAYLTYFKKGNMSGYVSLPFTKKVTNTPAKKVLTYKVNVSELNYRNSNCGKAGVLNAGQTLEVAYQAGSENANYINCRINGKSYKMIGVTINANDGLSSQERSIYFVAEKYLTPVAYIQ